MEFRKVLVVASVLGLAAFAQGCGNACDDYADAAAAKLDECGVEGTDGSTEDGAEVECTDAAATQAECLTPCVENVSCEALKGEDADGAAAYLDCIAGCA